MNIDILYKPNTNNFQYRIIYGNTIITGYASTETKLYEIIARETGRYMLSL